MVFAERFNLNQEDAAWAGLLHDCARCMSLNEQKAYVEKFNLSIPVDETDYPFLLHNRVGAHMAERDYGIEDRNVLAAIETHTCGDQEMSDLQKMVYIADAIEPTRTVSKDLKLTVLEALKGDLDQAFRLIVEYKLGLSRKKNNPLPGPMLRLVGQLGLA